MSNLTRPLNQSSEEETKEVAVVSQSFKTLLLITANNNTHKTKKEGIKIKKHHGPYIIVQ